MNKLTMNDVKQINKESGQYFFSPETMKFFRSRIESGLLKQKYFITSECAGDEHPRLYTIRKYDHKQHDIRTIGEFQGYQSEEDALDEIEGFDD